MDTIYIKPRKRKQQKKSTTMKRVASTRKKSNKKAKKITKKAIKTTRKSYKKTKRTIKKLNRNPKKLLKSEAKKLTKKIIKQLLKENESIDLEKATRSQLQKYLYNSIRLINEARPTMNRASVRAFNEAKKYFGSDENGHLRSAFKYGRKMELLEQARIAESILAGDGVSSIAIIRRNFHTMRAYKSFKKGATGKNLEGLNFDVYNDMVKIAGKVQSITSPSHYYQLFENLYEYKDTLGMETVGQITIEEFLNARGKDLEEDDVIDNILQRLKNELGKSNGKV